MINIPGRLAARPAAHRAPARGLALGTRLHWYWKADFYEEIIDEAIAVHRRYAETIPTPLSTMHMYPISGAATGVPEDATAFAYRNGGWAGVIAGIAPDPATFRQLPYGRSSTGSSCTPCPLAAATST